MPIARGPSNSQGMRGQPPCWRLHANCNLSRSKLQFCYRRVTPCCITDWLGRGGDAHLHACKPAMQAWALLSATSAIISVLRACNMIISRRVIIVNALIMNSDCGIDKIML
jgi:hypothetical protein